MSARPSPERTVSLNLLLMLLPLVAVLPVLVFALALLTLSWQQQRAQAERDVQQGVRTLAVAVDRELAASARELTRLAQYPTLSEANLRSFHTYARELVAAHDGWTDLMLIDADGRELMAARSPLDSAPRLLDRQHHKEVFRTGQPALSDIFADARSAELSIGLAVPVVRDGQVRWALGARFEPMVLARVLASQDVRPNMVAAIMDRNKLIVARNTLHDRFFGKSATADLQEASRSAAKGTAILTTLEDVRVFAAWEQVPMGWTVTVGIPQSQIDGPIRRQLGWLAIGGLLLMLAALGVSLTLGRRLERGLASAINDAQKLADGRPPPRRRSRVRELEALFAALRATHARLTAAADAENQATATVRESEERLRLAMDSVTMGSFDWSPATDQLISTARMRELFGFSPAEQPSLSAALQRIHAEDAPAAREAISHALDPAGDGSCSVQFRLSRPDRPRRWLDLRGQAMFAVHDGTRVPVRFIGMVLDITPQKEMELSLREADRRKDEFLAMLSHELRNPLSPIANALAILRLQPSLPVAAHQALSIAERQVGQMKRLIDDLLDISRITRGKIVLHEQPLDLAELARHAVDSLQPAARERGQRLQLTLPPQPLRVLGDRARLTQVIENLLGNAVKFSADHGLIELSGQRDGEAIVIKVRDDGVGIPPEQLNAVFDIFTQIDATLDRSQGGLGIGLALVRRLVQMHGGSVAAASEGPGRGATFSIRLPALPDEPGEPSTAHADASAAQGAAPAGRRVLVVDDNVDAADTLVALLELLGHTARAVYGGEEALAEVARFAPDTVLLDIGLPGISGVDVGRLLRARADGASITLIAISGYGQPADRAATTAAGFDAHLVKPVTPEDVERALARSAADRGSQARPTGAAPPAVR